MWCALVLLVWVTVGGEGREFTDQEIYKLPNLYDLDDYDRCLSQPDGLFCVGTFQLSADPLSPSHHYYKQIEEYSSNPLHFNRTLLHRGYCVSSRCPSRAPNSTRRFERCVQEQERALGLRIALRSHHCDVRTTHLTTDYRDQIFLWVVGLLLLLNCLGTLYDISTNDKNKSKILNAWSIRTNWHRLTSTFENGDPRFASLSPFQGIRVFLLLLVIITHVMVTSSGLFLQNPHYLERLFYLPSTMIMRNGSSIVQVFVVISNFLFAYNLLVISKNKKIGFSHLPICILHRIVRLMPVHMLMVGFAATWWRFTGNGPQWDCVVSTENNICRRKFFLHAFFLHNLVDNKEHCIVPSWFLAVDMQLFIIASLVMFTLMKTKWKPLPVMSALLILSCLMNGFLAYCNEWKSLLYVMVPETARTKMHNSSSFSNFYISPWGSLPSCFLGLMLAYVHNNAQEQGYKINKNKMFVWFCHLVIPLHISWIMSGTWVYEHKSPLAIAIYTTVERPVFSLLASILLFGIINNVDSAVRRVFSWRGWHVLGRVSLAALLLHWNLYKTLVASRRTLTDGSILHVAIEVCATYFFTYCLAVPLTILVEIPLMKTFKTLFFSE